ncbi:hypothetical protein DSO57_1033463 [Entomophthora muscae]|uniref:Uncharacterized protein n=1 Tax=Entomophthora muscae TaxID=34485 RepID=A0ACC2SP77_9FUNG|nr:hypothetical protein DSO57_1033463 [Entomophthora muscae]
MALCGINKDVSIEELFSRNSISLTHSFLWNFWENCKMLDAPNQKPPDDVCFRFTAQSFEQMHQIPSTENSSDLFPCCQLHIFNQQLFRQITFLQKSLTQPHPDFHEIFSSGFRLFSKIQLAEPTVYEWVSYLSNRDQKTLQDKMFLAKAGNAVTFLSLHILLLNLMYQIPKSPQDSKELSSLPSMLDICEKTLSVLSTIEKRGQQIFSKNDPHLINSICINLSIPYYYMALACLQDYSHRGYLVFYACLEKLRNLSSYWNVVSSWIVIIVERRKNDLPLTTPPLALDSK